MLAPLSPTSLSVFNPKTKRPRAATVLCVDIRNLLTGGSHLKVSMIKFGLNRSSSAYYVLYCYSSSPFLSAFCTLVQKTTISLFLSFRESQSTALAGLKEHSVKPLHFLQTRKHQLLLLQTRKQHTHENHHPCIQHYNFHHHPASHPTSCYPAGPTCPSP